MIIYMVQSGRKTKVGKAEDETRARHYRTHNPDHRFVAKVFDLDEDDADWLERIVHKILGATPGDEWTFASEEDVERAISVATECLELIWTAKGFQLAFDIPRQHPDPRALVDRYGRDHRIHAQIITHMSRVVEAISCDE